MNFSVASGASIAVNDGTTTSSNSFPTSGDGLANSTALQTVVETSTQGLLVFGYDPMGVASVTTGLYSNSGPTFGSLTGTISITVRNLTVRTCRKR